MSDSPKITPTELRANIYRYLDRILETGEPLVIERKGRTLRIAVDEPTNKLAALERHPEYVVGDPEDLVHLDWSSEWNP